MNKNNVILCLSTALIFDNISVEQRMNEYQECFNILKKFGYKDFYIVETVVTESPFMEKNSDKVYYTNVNGKFRNRGSNYVNGFKKFLNENSFGDDDIIIHITGRYPLITDNFIKKVINLDKQKIGSFRKDEYNQFHLFMFALRYKILKNLLNSIDVPHMERNMINLERIFSDYLPHQDIDFVDFLGIVGRQSNEKNPLNYGKIEF